MNIFCIIIPKCIVGKHGTKVVSTSYKELLICPAVPPSTSLSLQQEQLLPVPSAYDTPRRSKPISGRPPLSISRSTITSKLSYLATTFAKVATPVAKLAMPRVKADPISKGLL
jgi:hypothetical protein